LASQHLKKKKKREFRGVRSITWGEKGKVPLWGREIKTLLYLVSEEEGGCVLRKGSQIEGPLG